MPREVHEHYDADGTYTGHTVVTRESPWDDETRARALALTDYEGSICGCGCGQPISKAYSDKQAFKVDKFTCMAGRAIAKVRRAAQDEARNKQFDDGWDDGLHYYAVPADPEGGGDGSS